MNSRTLKSHNVNGPFSMEDSGGANLFPEDFLKSSSLYVRHLAQKEEVAKHKWYESEKVGKDVGDDYAFFDWLLKHSSSWRASQQK